MNHEEAIKAAIPDGRKYTNHLQKALSDLCKEMKKIKSGD